MKSLFAFVTAFFASLILAPAAQVDPFSEGVRPTDPLPATEQAKTFKLPPGFKIELVAAEPDLQKPMNMAFDSKGRLWVTMSREYPFPAPLDKPARDMIKVFEDFDENGRARKITTFADGLNIPIGIYPYKNGVIAWSIPNIYFFQDTDGDGKSDKKEVLFGPFGWERDTHGNQASFRRGFDGWLYATHGFNNNSHVRARDGSEVRMNSGNTYRMRINGERIEHHTFGQVNPFGMAFDPSGNIYTADCHSAPIYELLRGGYYPSFGKPHDGLGFAPTMLEHSHGSTAICGIIFYADDQWPAEYQNNILIGNVMTSRINRDTLLPRGSSKTAREEKDFLTTTDPWFRPVDLQLGPDGALYVADFYNRIIGHYEVPLTHPGRDFERARIWKISYVGEGKSPSKLPDFSRADANQLIAEFKHANMTRRMLAMNELIDRLGNSATSALRAAINKRDAARSEMVHSLWSLQRLAALDQETLRKFISHTDRDVRIHAMRILSEHEDFASVRQTAALRALQDQDATVQRAAADALGQFPEPEAYVRPLLNALARAPKEDDHLRHTIRMALRNQVKEGGAALTYKRYKSDDAQTLADISLAIPHEDAATFLLDHIQSGSAGSKLSDYARHAARHSSEKDVIRLTSFVGKTYANDVDQQLAFFKAIREGGAQRGMQLPSEARTWGEDLAANLLKSATAENISWRNLPIPGKPASANPWFLQKRESADGNKDSLFICSLPPGGEHFTGVLRSGEFTLPEWIAFYLAGHDGVPTEAAKGNNLVRLVESGTGKVLVETAPQRNDIAQQVHWDLGDHKGKRAYIELIDGDTGNAYAWIAAGRFDPSVVPMPKVNPNQISARLQSAADIARSLQLTALTPDLSRFLSDASVDVEAQGAIATAVVALEPNEHRLALAPLLGDGTIPAELRQKVGKTLAAGKSANSLEVLVEAMRTVPARGQLKLAQSLASSSAGAETLLAMVEKRQASPQVLLDRSVQDKFKALNSPATSEKLAKLTENLEAPSEAVQKQIEQLRTKYQATKTASSLAGAEVFTKNCAICHQIDGTGALIGPQLDGIGGRGLERLLEDTLDPNRNVDVNFRTQIVVLKDGDVVTGLFRREEGELLILADSTGKEITVPKNQIESRRESETSLMPSNFGDIIPEKEFHDLLAFLLSKAIPRGDH
ncbi:MAG TPA: PVC-type heme-binding CxxCH protein [Verrucomicrobiae bacterium]